MLIRMGMWDRLGNVIKSYLNDDNAEIPWKGGGARRSDPDLDAAFDELNDFLNRDTAAPKTETGGARAYGANANKAGETLPPEALRPDFAELGLPFGASARECKEAYKKLLKIHHPDKHAGHEGNFKKATEKCARINAASDRIEQWRRGG